MKTANSKTKILVITAILALSPACAKLSFTEVPQTKQDTVVPQEPPPPFKTISKTEVVAYGNKQVDFLLVLDDSNSMLPELKKLAAKMSTFVSSLDANNIDWQMCITTTRGISAGGNLKFGAPLDWANYSPKNGESPKVLKKGTNNLNTIFNSTVDGLTIGGGASGDERAIKAAHDNFLDSNIHGCYRKDAAISVIVISDEDERSLGGKPENRKAKDTATAYQPLESDDLPQTLIDRAKTTFGSEVRFTFNSIIVKPDDNACEAEQDKDTSPSHKGHIYAEASRLTDGGIGSICDADYGANLNTFKDKIVNSLTALALDCEPERGKIEVKIEGIEVSSSKLDGRTLKFEYPLIEGTKIDLKYDCLY